MSSEWYVSTNGREDGPLTLAEVRERVANGTLQPTDRVSADRVTWLPAGEALDVTFAHSDGATVVGSGPPAALVAGTAAPATPLTSVPGYEIQEQLGAGGCGIVYRAVQTRLGRIVALKTVRLSDGTSAETLARFEREARALAQLQHPNIVAVHDCGHADGRAFFAMELLAGEDLKQRIDRSGRLDETTAWQVARQTAAALAHAAEHGTVHRDIKPANLFLVPPPAGFPLPSDVPMVKVTDFGLALTHTTFDETEQRTAQGVLLGTPVYMAPEQFRGSAVDHRADIYSLGATVYHSLAGAPPFSGKTVWELLAKKAAPLDPLGPPVSKESADLVAAMMATDPNQRPADYAILLARIDTLLGAAPTPRPELPPTKPRPALPPDPPQPSRRVLVVGTLALLVGAVACGLVWNARRNRTPAEVPTPPAPTPAEYVVASQEMLYTPGSMLGWIPFNGTVVVERDNDIEQTQALVARDGAVRALRAGPNFRVALALDPHHAKEVEVTVATGAGERWAIRLNQSAGIAFGKRSASGAFEPVGQSVPLPTRKELAEQGRRAYLELSYRRAGGTLEARVRDTSLGSTPDTGLLFNELRVQGTGGPVRIDFAMLEELTDRPSP